MRRITLSASALSAAMNAELYLRGVPAFVRVAEVVRAQAAPGWSFALERSPVPLHDHGTAERFAEGLFGYEREVDAVAAWAAERFTVAWDAAPAREPVFIPSPVHAGAPPPSAGQPVVVKNTTAGGE